MTMQRIYKIVGLIVLCFLPGCGKVIDWGKDSFHQGEQLQTSREHSQKYIHSVTVYNQFTTKAKFDAMWLSDAVRTDYADLHALKYGKNEEQKKKFLRRQLEENKHFISFYVLSLYEISLGDANSQWSVLLRIGANNYAPIEVKTVDLSPEYIHIFGKRFNRFKVAYSIKFDARDIEDQSLITLDTDKISLYFRSVEKEVSLVWHAHQPDKVKA